MFMLGAFFAANTFGYLTSGNTVDEQTTETQQSEQEKVEKKTPTKSKKKIEQEPTIIFEKKEEYSFHDVCEVSEDCECQFGFKRKDFKKEETTGNVAFHQKFIFVCSGLKSSEWPEKLEKETV